MAAQDLVARLEHRQTIVLVRQVETAGLRPMRQARALLQRQLVRAHVLHAERPGLVQLLAPAFHRLAGRAEDEIHADVREARRPGALERRDVVRGGVGAGQRLQVLVPERLPADRQPVHAGVPQRGQRLRGQAVGIGLQADLRVRRHGEGVPRRRDQAEHVAGGQQTGRSAAEVDRRDGAPRKSRVVRRATDLVRHRVHIRRPPRRVPHHEVERAVVAACGTEGKVDVEREGRPGRCGIARRRPRSFAGRTSGRVAAAAHRSIFSTERKASCGTVTEPTCFIRFLPSFCFSRSLRFREMSPP